MKNLTTLFFALYLTSTVLAQSVNVQPIPPIKDGLREQYTPSDFETFRLKEKNGEIPFAGGLVDMQAATDALVNNNTGSTGTSNFTQSEMSIIAFGNNVVIGFNDSGSNSGGANKFTGWSYSTNGGASFTDGGTLPTNSGGDAGDPVLARNETTGRIYLSTLGYSTSTIQMFRSDDNGVTWMAPVNATPGGSSEDKQWHTVDNFAGSGNGNVYMISRRFGSPSGIYAFRSTDNGATFGPTGGVQIFTGGQGAFIAVGPDHSVYAFYYNGSTSILVRKSTDFGVTFGSPVTIYSGLTGGTNGDLNLTGLRQGTASYSYFRSNAFPHVVVNPVSGHLYATFDNNPAGTDKADVYMAMSTDGAATWTAPVRVNDDATTTDQWQPTIAVTPDGNNLGIFYYSRQEDVANNNLLKYYGRLGTISGSVVSFTSSFAISDVASLPEFGRDGVVVSVYMGDYQHAVATNDAFHVTWADNRDDLTGGAPRKDPNVYYEKVVIGPPCPVVAPTNLTPANGATGLPLNGNSLTWSNGAGTVSNEVWFGPSGSIVKVYDGAAITSYGLPALNYNTTYYWYIVSKDASCSVSGPMWTFTTLQDPNLSEWCDAFANLNNWTVIGPLGTANWSASGTSNAGGTAPELRMSWTPSFNGISKIRSTVISLPNNQQITYSFNYYFDYYANPSGTVTVAVTYDGGTTSSAFYTQVDATGNVGPLVVTGNFTTPASGSQNTQLEITFNGNSFNNDNIYWDNMCLSWVVPVELTSFAATSNGADVELNWTTATETNNQGFQVERMSAGGSYEQVGYVAGFGTTTEPKAYSFIDSKLESGSYTYRLKQVDFDGTYTYSNEVNVEVEIPLVYSLEQNYPNPFNPSTTIKYSIADEGFVKLVIFNMLGEEVATLVNTQQKAGKYEVNFSAKGGSASGGNAYNLSSGVYVYRLETANFVTSKKLILLR